MFIRVIIVIKKNKKILKLSIRIQYNHILWNNRAKGGIPAKDNKLTKIKIPINGFIIYKFCKDII